MSAIGTQKMINLEWKVVGLLGQAVGGATVVNVPLAAIPAPVAAANHTDSKALVVSPT